MESDEVDMDSADRRKTSRINAGVNPVRFGQSIDTSQRKTRPPIVQNEADIPTAEAEETHKSPGHSSVSSRSVRSFISSFSNKSRSSTVRQREIEFHTEEQIAALEEEHDQKLRGLKQLEFEAKQLIDKVEGLKKQQSSLSDENALQLHIAELDKAEEELKSKSDQVQQTRIDVEFYEKSLQRKKNLLQKKADLDKHIINEEDDDDNSSQNITDDEEEDMTISASNLVEERERLERVLANQQQIAEARLDEEKRNALKRKTNTDSNNEHSKRPANEMPEYSEED